MFGKERSVKKKVFFLLKMDCNNHPWDIPEITLWLTFESALKAAMLAVSSGAEGNEKNEVLEIDKDTAFMWHCFEIMPISISTHERITWFGKECKKNELHA